MEIIVPIKQVPDVALNIKVKDGAVVEEGLSYVISSWDETALEAALQMTEDVGGEVTLLTVGPERLQNLYVKVWQWVRTKRFMSNTISLKKPTPLHMRKFCKKFLKVVTMI